MPQPQIDNPRGAFGYTTAFGPGPATQPYHEPEVRVFRNVSPNPIAYGQIVTLYVNSSVPYGSTAGGTSGIDGTTADDCAYVTTIGGQRGIVGIALTAATSYSTVGASPSSKLTPAANAPASQYFQVVTRGPFYGMICSSAAAMVPGDIIVNTNSTVSASVNFPSGGVGGSPTSANFGPITTGLVAQRGVVGWFITTGTTIGSTATWGTSKTLRANVWVEPSNIVQIGTT